MTSIGLLLGVSSAKLGTMDMSITRLLGIHIPALLPPTSTELDVPHNVQVRVSTYKEEDKANFDFHARFPSCPTPKEISFYPPWIIIQFFICFFLFLFLLQVAAVIGIGLVYQGTGHRHNAEVLLSEIGV